MSNTDNDQVILVNERDKEIGYADKLEAHQKGTLHRAFSVCLFRYSDDDGWLTLLQQRHPDKYHCGGLWSNTCCSHPRKGENTLAAAQRRLQEEMGMQTKLHHVESFIYRAEFDNGLIEHELDHVFVGICQKNEEPTPCPPEVSDTQWIAIKTLLPLKNNDQYTPWMEEALIIAKTPLVS